MATNAASETTGKAKRIFEKAKEMCTLKNAGIACAAIAAIGVSVYVGAKYFSAETVITVTDVPVPAPSES